MASLLNLLSSRVWQSYNRALFTSPLLTKSFTSFTGFIIGDSIAQLATKGAEPSDFRRTARFAAFGFAIHAPGCHFFYKMLDSLVYPAASKRFYMLMLLFGTKAVVAKMLIDQTMWTPFSICIFYSVFKTLEGRPDQILQTIKEKFWSTLLAGYTIWPLANLINFRYISNQHRVLYINVIQVGWNVVLCKIATSDSPASAERKLKKRDSEDDLQNLEAGIQDDRRGVVELANRRR